MQSFKADFSQLAFLDGDSLPRPTPVRSSPPRRRLPQGECDALVSALDAGKAISPSLGCLLEIVRVGISPPTVGLLRPSKMPVHFELSKSSQLTVAGALTVSAFAAVGVVGSGGVYGSTTREVGVFLSGGG